MRRSFSSMGISFAGHAVVVALLALAPRALETPPVESIEVELTMEALPPEPADVPIARLDVTPPTSTSGARARPTASAAALPIPELGTTEMVVETVLDGIVPGDVVIVPEPGETAEERAERIRRAIDPRRVALDMVLDESPGPTTRGEPAGLELGPSVPLLSEAEAESLHSSHLADAAALRAWLSHTAIEPHERPDGTWVWEGPLFTATIDPDGEVHFDDIDAVSVDWASGTATFDLMDMIMSAAGQDPYAAERERFMEETEELRIGIEDAWSNREVERRLRIFRGSLVRIWNDDDRPAVSRRRAIFSQWDEVSEDDAEGRACRAAVVDFVREEIPFGSEDAYTEAELGALNALRVSGERFDPY